MSDHSFQPKPEPVNRPRPKSPREEVQSQQQFAHAGSAAPDPGSQAPTLSNTTHDPQVLTSWLDRVAPASPNPSSTSVEQIASSGMQGSVSSLPYQNRLESAFGADLSGIPVYQGPQAQQAAAGLDAEAFAHRGSVVLGGTPDLRTVAEETAHVLQSRRGGASGLTSPHSSVELEASTAADSVVSGSVVGPLSGGLAEGAVARKKRNKAGKHSRTKENPQKSSTERMLESKRVGTGPGKISKQELNRVRRTVSHKGPAVLKNKDNADAHVRTQGAIHQEMWGKDGKKRSTLTKVIPGGGGLISGRFDTNVKGSIGYEQTTAGMTANQSKAALGLDYNNSSYTKPGENADGRREFNDDPVTYLRFGATAEMADKKDGLKVAMGPGMLGHKAGMGADPLAQFPADRYDGSSGDPTVKGNAYRGTGITGTNMAEGLDTINQELVGNQPLKMPGGAQMMHRDNDPTTPDELVATFKKDKANPKGKWEYNPNCPPDILVTYKQDELKHTETMLSGAQTTFDEESATATQAQKHADKATADAKKLEGEAKELDKEAQNLEGQAASMTDDQQKTKTQNQARGKKSAATRKRNQATQKRQEADEQQKEADKAQKEADEAEKKVTELTPKVTTLKGEIKALQKKGKKKTP